MEDSLGLDTASFDPLSVLYSSDHPELDDNVPIHGNFSQCLESMDFDSESSLGAFLSIPTSATGEARLGSPSKTKNETEAVRNSKQTAGKDENRCVAGAAAGGSDKDGEAEEKETVNDDNKLDAPDENKAVNDFLKHSSDEDTDIPAYNRDELRRIRRRDKTQRTVLTEMMMGFDEGPLNILKRSVVDRLKVRVLTRNVRGIRGISTGYIIAFDKHMNLAMMDVDEVYRKPCGKHQKKSKQKQAEDAPSEPATATEEAQPGSTSQDEEMEDKEEKKEVQTDYPTTPWVAVDSTGKSGTTFSTRPFNTRPSLNEEYVPADGIGNLPSVFSAMHVFQDNEATRLLGTKSRRVLSRHLNQVLLRGDHVLAVALVQ